MKAIINEINTAWSNQDIVSLNKFIDVLHKSMYCGDIVGIGAGRMGYSLRGFIMRLAHMGCSASFIGDTNLPRVNKNSTVIINSSSGETPTNIVYAQQAKAFNANLLVVTQKPNSTIAKLSNACLVLPEIKSEQVMKTFSEQYSFLIFDFISNELVKKSRQNDSDLQLRHSIFE